MEVEELEALYQLATARGLSPLAALLDAVKEACACPASTDPRYKGLDVASVDLDGHLLAWNLHFANRAPTLRPVFLGVKPSALEPRPTTEMLLSPLLNDPVRRHRILEGAVTAIERTRTAAPPAPRAFERVLYRIAGLQDIANQWALYDELFPAGLQPLYAELGSFLDRAPWEVAPLPADALELYERRLEQAVQRLEELYGGVPEKVLVSLPNNVYPEWWELGVAFETDWGTARAVRNTKSGVVWAPLLPGWTEEQLLQAVVAGTKTWKRAVPHHPAEANAMRQLKEELQATYAAPLNAAYARVAHAFQLAARRASDEPFINYETASGGTLSLIGHRQDNVELRLDRVSPKDRPELMRFLASAVRHLETFTPERVELADRAIELISQFPHLGELEKGAAYTFTFPGRSEAASILFRQALRPYLDDDLSYLANAALLDPRASDRTLAELVSALEEALPLAKRPHLRPALDPGLGLLPLDTGKWIPGKGALFVKGYRALWQYEHGGLQLPLSLAIAFDPELEHALSLEERRLSPGL